MPKLDTSRWAECPGAINRLSGQNDGPYAELVLGDQASLTQFGVRHKIDVVPIEGRTWE